MPKFGPRVAPFLVFAASCLLLAGEPPLDPARPASGVTTQALRAAPELQDITHIGFPGRGIELAVRSGARLSATAEPAVPILSILDASPNENLALSLSPGETLWIEDAYGARRFYSIVEAAPLPGDSSLVLISCYPAGERIAGAPLQNFLLALPRGEA